MESRYAGFWIRVVASLVDGIILFLPLNGIEYIIFSLVYPDISYWDFFLGRENIGFWTIFDTINFFFSTVIGLSYYGFLTSKFGGTPGKLLFGLHVVGEDGEFISIGRSIGRYFSYMLSEILFIGYIMVAFTTYKQGLHDKICKTYVIKKQAAHT